jgi:regulatory protein YycI of two-component signal transduction system YycFG
MDDIEFVTDYKGHAIYQDMDNGYFYTSDEDDNVISYEATMEMLREDLDQRG